MARSNQRGSKNNNPEGRNQYNNSWADTAKERPMATAAAAAAAVGAGVFLWSRRNQISDQISSLGHQISDWSSNMMANDGSSSDSREMSADGTGSTSSRSNRGSSSSSPSSRSAGSRTSSSRSGRGSGAMDEIGIIEVDTVTL